MLSTHRQPAPHSSATVSATAGGAMLRVMVVDDQRTMRKIVRQLLAAISIREVIEAANGKEALALLDQPNAPQVDLIICDLNMPEMDGLGLCNAIRHSEILRRKHIPFLLLTAERDEFVLDVVRQVGAADVANKPISAPDLQRHIEGLIGVKLN